MLCVFFLIVYNLFYLFFNKHNNNYNVFVNGTLKDLKSNNTIDGITLYLNNKFIHYKVHARGIYLDIDFDDLEKVKKVIDTYSKNEKFSHCNIKKKINKKRGKKSGEYNDEDSDGNGEEAFIEDEEEQEEEKKIYNKKNVIDWSGLISEGEYLEDGILKSSSCVIFLNIKHEQSLKYVYSFMDYMYKNTYALALIFICDNFLYKNEINNPHDDLNITLIEPSILAYLIPADLMLPYKKEQFNEYSFELFWGIEKKTDVVHMVYYLDLGKYFNYTFFLFMKNFLLQLKNDITYEIKFTIYRNFAIDPTYCFLRDTSYCISKPDYINTDMTRKVIEQKVTGLCIYKLTAVKNKKLVYTSDTSYNIDRKNNNNNNNNNNTSSIVTTQEELTKQNILNEKKNDSAWPISKYMFSKEYILYLNALFDLDFEQRICSNGSNDLTKLCSNNIISFLGMSVEEVYNCFVQNFHTYIGSMIKTRFYVFSIVINDKLYKMKLNKDIAIQLICSAFKNIPQVCIQYIKDRQLKSNPAKRESKHEHLKSLVFLILLFIAHLLGTYINYYVVEYVESYEKNNKYND
ncbi:conserved protein, unknown function [Hepatocystis sp. ex Piliocolobus tephrosceles]|nr:conserved protein, unknown function [Hepatocystis sp. ex Piliocolobus tephrosceles]